MPRHAFYDSPAYREKQSAITKRNQDLGLYEFNKKEETRVCMYIQCRKFFIAKPHDPKKFCSKSCGIKVSNTRRTMSDGAKQKIATALKGKPSPFKGLRKVPKVARKCARPECVKSFFTERWRKLRYCSALCAMKVVGGQPTSPKASRGKAGVRPDISKSLYFYSRWEANMARLYTYQGIEWEFTPKTFDIGGQRYTPDFYLPETSTYIEVKNFWNEYSRIRDLKFRERYPDVLLKVILKDEYYALEKQYASRIPFWEYNFSPIPTSKN